MSTVVFKYQKEHSKIKDVIYRPVEEITLKTDDSEIRVLMYIDSGADITIIPRMLGESLGFKVGDSKIIELSGIGEGKIPVVLRNVKLKIGENEFKSKIAWALIEKVPPLLGRLDVFEKYRIIFDESERKIIFEWKGE